MSVGRGHHSRHHLRSDHRPVQRRLLWGGSSDGGEMGELCAVSRLDLARKCKDHVGGPLVRED